jgi:ribonuclease P protein component
LIDQVSAAGRGPAERLTFRRRERIKSGDDIKRAFSRGRKVSCRGAKLFYLENGTDDNRIAFTFARKYGNAVERNRSRRLSRETYRLMKSRLKRGFDLVVLVYPGDDAFLRRKAQFDSLFRKAGLIADVT